LYILTDSGVLALGKTHATIEEITDYFAVFVDQVKIVVIDGAVVAMSAEAPNVILGFADKFQSTPDFSLS
jgi:hypothetical protein